MSELRRVVVYTDGGAEPNPGIGGWAAVLIDPLGGERRELCGGAGSTTNNRMELTAAIRALEALESGHLVDLHTDSSYLRLGITQWLERWKAAGWRLRDGEPVKNDDLWRELEAATSRHRVRWHWVKGHSGQEHNERADALAAEEIQRRRGSAPPRRVDAGSGGTAGPAVDAAGGASDGPIAERPPDVVVLLKLSCVGGRGAWAVQVRRGDEERMLGGGASGVTANRTELLAAAEVLESLPEGERIEWRGGSDYLSLGASKWLAGWRRRGYRTSSGDPVKNDDLWRRIERAVAQRVVHFQPPAADDGPVLGALEREIGKRLGRPS